LWPLTHESVELDGFFESLASFVLSMGDSWEDEDDWETEADRLVAGVNLHDVDESKFEGEADAPVEDDWENDVPATQVRYSSCQLNTAGRLQH
jgi:hypothetical protein